MADTVTSNVLSQDGGRYVVLLTASSDGTGESNVAKVDLSAITDSSGRTPIAADIEFIEYDIQGYTSIRLHWDHTTDDTALQISGAGEMDFTPWGMHKDPRTAGGTGDLLLTTTGHSSGDTYTILLACRLRNDP
jgi:hypothetical protein